MGMPRSDATLETKHFQSTFKVLGREEVDCPVSERFSTSSNLFDDSVMRQTSLSSFDFSEESVILSDMG